MVKDYLQGKTACKLNNIQEGLYYHGEFGQLSPLYYLYSGPTSCLPMCDV